MTLHPVVEEMIANGLLQTEQGVQLVMDPQTAQRLISNIAHTVEEHPEIAASADLADEPNKPPSFIQTHQSIHPQLAVLSHNEITSDANVKSIELWS